MPEPSWRAFVDRPIVTVDGNEAAAYVAHKLSEVIAIYPITPSTAMGEMADAWSAAGRTNLWRNIPTVMEMQSEGGAAGACHGAIQAGALTTTFTASQGLLLMIPNMYKIAGELSSTVIHVSARTVATHALSIFGDHSDVMAVRQTGFAMLASASVQEAQDMAAVAHAASLRTRVPFVHFFDGFRTSSEVAKIERLTDDDLRAMIDPEAVAAHRARAMDPEHPVLRGTAQNPDVFFQAREASNPFHAAVPAKVQESMDELADLTGRRYRLFDYYGAPDAERVVVLMGSGVGAALEAIGRLTSEGEKVGVLVVRLYRPFATEAFMAVLPKTVKSLAVLDRTKEPGALGEPLYQDVVTSLVEAASQGTLPMESIPRVIGGRYGLSSKEFTPAMVKAALDEAGKDDPKLHFTLGIVDDVTHLSLAHDEEWDTDSAKVVRALFFGLGSDGTVGANKNSVKIIGEHTPMHAQGYFVYDSKKSGAMTVSHLRFGDGEILSTYLIDKASFVACHQFGLMEKVDVLSRAKKGAKFLLNSPYGKDGTWDRLTRDTQKQIIDKQIEFYVVDGYQVAAEAGLGGRINTVLQTCFFALAGILPADEAVEAIKESIRKTYGKRGETVLTRNFAAVDGSIAALHRVDVPAEATSTKRLRPAVPDQVPDFVERVTSMIIDGKGDLLPVSAMPVDGTFPTATAQYEKRSIAMEIPIWDSEICIDCARCPLVCPHAAIRVKYYDPALLADAPEGFQHAETRGKDFPGKVFTIQVAPDDCTGCGVCVNICPAKSKEEVKHKAINMVGKDDYLDRERVNYSFFLDLPEVDRTTVNVTSLKGSQSLLPLFEYSGACSGCGETPYVKLVSQLFGDRMIVANATGCSSIYGGNLPTTPWAVDADGRGPTWSNSLFEDNAEFGLGMRLAIDQRSQAAFEALADVADVIGDDLLLGVVNAEQTSEQGIKDQRGRVAEIRSILEKEGSPRARWALSLLDSVIRKSVWIMGGDGWAYDIGFGGLDHVMASGRDVNMLVLDTEVYSNTGGQASKATPRAAIAKFASGGKVTGKKDLGMIAMAYGNVYVAQIAMGANMSQTVRAIAEAESYRGPSLIIAYSPCIAHGIDMADQMDHQKDAVATGYWPMYRFDPRMAASEEHPFALDSREPTMPFADFAKTEARFAMLTRTNPERADRLFAAAQEDITERRRWYEQLAGVERGLPGEDVSS
ncbi:MAG: pyruvate:ferredoxin (flavodoxin) oxidoreductase [Actinobacteria bacterium]|nr:pyruvate:ferredoxin (flavodoxin) oxidoreductase [Actinomycetota bacterium]